MVAHLDKDISVGKDRNADAFVVESRSNQRPIANWLQLFKLLEAELNDAQRHQVETLLRKYISAISTSKEDLG